jgi:hypothetical protein
VKRRPKRGKQSAPVKNHIYSAAPRVIAGHIQRIGGMSAALTARRAGMRSARAMAPLPFPTSSTSMARCPERYRSAAPRGFRIGRGNCTACVHLQIQSEKVALSLM